MPGATENALSLEGMQLGADEPRGDDVEGWGEDDPVDPVDPVDSSAPNYADLA